MKTPEPWEIAPPLTEERLAFIAYLLAKTRHMAVLSHEPSKGDSNWGLGCRVYERSCRAIEKAAEERDWLAVLEPQLHFVFLVGGLPLRFGRGDHEDPNPRLLKRRPSEERAQQLAFEHLDYPGPAQASEEQGRLEFGSLLDWRWRVIVEIDGVTLEASQIALIQATPGGFVQNWWPLKLPDLSQIDLSAVVNGAQGLGPPSVGVKQARNTG